jgi:inner membrane protein
MENLTHTLFGLSLAKIGLERATPLATATLVISSNLPDIDVLPGVRSGALAYIEYHRGFTHSFIGLALLAAALTAILTYVDRKFRLRKDPFSRPVKPARLFYLAYLGGLGHTFMDFTNAYGVRLFEPLSSRWFYGDLVFVADPWIWLILGAAIVWLTTTDLMRATAWLTIGLIASLLVALSYSNPTEFDPAIATSARLAWFLGLALVAVGLALRWGRAGAKLVKWSLFLLALYYSLLWMAHQAAKQQASSSPPAPDVREFNIWPTPANPMMWKSVAAARGRIYIRFINLGAIQLIRPATPLSADETGWRQMSTLDQKFVDALRGSYQAHIFLDFARYPWAVVEEREDGYEIKMRDARFDLELSAHLDRELNVESAEVQWY